MKNGLLLLSIIWMTNFVHSQDCGCSDVFVWLKETIEKNDAGFQYVIDQKGENAYKDHSDSYAEKVKSITDKTECAETLSNWLRFFRNGHLSFGINAAQNLSGNNETDQEKIKTQFKDWEVFPYKEKEFNAYISTIKQPGLEGVWTTSTYTIGVRKVKDGYIGFILKGDDSYWNTGQVKFKIAEKDGKLTATYYMRNHSAQEMKHVGLIGNNYLQMDWITLERVSPVFPADKSVDLFFKLLTTDRPLFEKLNDNTAILRIPTFNSSAKKQIDSVIQANQHLITTTENLILDLRNNGGGSDMSFEKILPFIYTNPIRTVGAAYLSTPLNNQRMKQFMTDPDFSEADVKWAKDGLEKLQKHLGEFVSLDSTDVTVKTLDTIYTYPKNVGIIINEGNGSTTEQFILAAKQSKKVKLFGTTTAGVLDISNMHFISSPCNDYQLGYSLTKSKRIPDFTIDGKGIQPDYYIDNSIPEYEWIDFVNKTLSNQ